MYNLFVILIIVFTVYTLVTRSKRSYVYTDDGRIAVRPGPTQLRAIDILREARQAMDTLFTELRGIRSGPIYNIAQRLLQCEADGIYLYEHRPSDIDTTVAYAYAQSQEIYVCLFDEKQIEVDNQVLFSIILHELVHLIVRETHGINGNTIHTKSFKHTEKLLMSLSERLGLLPLMGVTGKPYCGISIPQPSTSM